MLNSLEENSSFYTAFKFKESGELEQWEKGLLSEVKWLRGLEYYKLKKALLVEPQHYTSISQINVSLGLHVAS
jgi:hypothetical protein